jgi:hypothetical protein
MYVCFLKATTQPVWLSCVQKKIIEKKCPREGEGEGGGREGAPAAHTAAPQTGT